MLDFIGTGSAFNTELGNNGAYIRKDNLLFMIDCGSATYSRLQQSGILSVVDRVFVLITHTHPDHIGSLGDLIFHGYYSMGVMNVPSVHIMAPNAIDIKRILHNVGVSTELYGLTQFDLNAVTVDLPRHNFNLTFEAIPVNHVKELECFGYILEYEGQRIYYSGDCYEIPEDILAMLHEGKFDYFYQDTCKAHYPGNVHLSLELLTDLVQPEVRNKVYCMHLDKTFDPKYAEYLGFKVAGAHVNESKKIQAILELTRGQYTLDYLTSLSIGELNNLYMALLTNKIMTTVGNVGKEDIKRCLK